MSTRLRGTFVDTPSLGQLHIYQDYILEYDNDGYIIEFRSYGGPHQDKADYAQIPEGSFILPTFNDLHLHAPQFLYQGTGLDLPLMEWLDKYTYRAEERLDNDSSLARKVYRSLAQRLVKNGTGAVSLFGTIKNETNLILAEQMQKAGIRARVGKLSMDISSRPTYVEKSAEASLDAANDFVNACHALSQELPASQRLVEPVLTPRFVPTCSDEVLCGLAKLSATRSPAPVAVQSHLAEAHDQVEWVRSTRGKEDIDVFDDAGLLTPHTLQAHCTFLSLPGTVGTDDLTRIAQKGVSIAHCPLSNVYFSERPFALREALEAGVKVGLGTDVAGGYSSDIMSSMRNAVAVSRLRENERKVRGEGTNKATLAITWKESLYLATLGGAVALGMAPNGGLFQVGAPFDAQMVELWSGKEHGVGTGPIDFFDIEEQTELTSDIIEKWWCIGDDRNRVGMWVQGRKIL